jgi:hypothetical protein
VAGTAGWRRCGDRIHGFLLERVYPRPGSAILLDAPTSVLLSRKEEGTWSSLEARRQEYRVVANKLSDVVVLDVSQKEEDLWAALLDATVSVLAGKAPGRRP